MKNYAINIEDALESFATEFATNPHVLPDYLVKYPQFSIELVDLSRELSHMAILETDTSRDDAEYLNASLNKFRNITAQPNGLQSAPYSLFKNVAKQLKIPFLIMLSIRERRVEPSTISNQFLELFAKALGATVQDFQSYLSLPTHVTAKASKADQKPIMASKVSFEEILNDAQISPQDLVKLLEKTE
jgi:hypothetical protein